jgi:hypothetical protein
MERIEIGIAIDAQDDILAIDDEMLLAVLQRSLNDPRKSLCPIVSASGNQPNPIAIALNTQAVAVILHFVEPIRAVRNFGPARRDTELKCLKHEPQIGRLFGNCESARN